ncbi:hypothetical protein FRX31_034219 [Thalictrum thalictroides]|uniref:Uncharacterized protein n=1 Tax=Thalictrum thalictroides TaxID=46969 RepID=A0A7J6UUB6_THATH|nr:hypothetical protein FRX31_034219 [Thalictrum thalictroides]
MRYFGYHKNNNIEKRNALLAVILVFFFLFSPRYQRKRKGFFKSFDCISTLRSLHYSYLEVEDGCKERLIYWF